jgi:hypothetical protein
MRFAVAFGGVLGAAVLALAGARPAAALSVQDFQNLPQTLGDSADLKRYMTGFRDALYDFNAVLDSIGVRVFCPAPGTPPMDVAELKHRLDADLTEKRNAETDYDTYARETSIGLVALEVLAAVYPCSDDEKSAPQPPPQ